MENHSSHKSIWGAVILLLFSIATAAFGVYLCFYANDREPVSLADMGNPSEVADAYFDALSKGEYEDCDLFLSDFSIAEMNNEPESELGKIMHALLVDSYNYELLNESEVVGMDASVSVKVTYMDLTLLGNAMKETANAIAGDLNYHGEDIFSEEAAMSIALEALEAVECSASDFCVSDEITIALVYDGSEWKILYNESLENMLLGKG